MWKLNISMAAVGAIVGAELSDLCVCVCVFGGGG